MINTHISAIDRNQKYFNGKAKASRPQRRVTVARYDPSSRPGWELLPASVLQHVLELAPLVFGKNLVYVDLELLRRLG